MKNKNSDTPFFDLDRLITPEYFIAAAETEDELGCVLRIHLCLERFLDEFIEKMAPQKDKKFHPQRPQFGGKLSLAVAYGLCESIAEPICIINKVRNNFAHRSGILLLDADNNNIANCVDQIKVMPEEQGMSVKNRWVELCVIRPGEKLGFGKHGARIDFVIVCSDLLRKATGWMVVEYIRRNPDVLRKFQQP